MQHLQEIAIIVGILLFVTACYALYYYRIEHIPENIKVANNEAFNLKKKIHKICTIEDLLAVEMEIIHFEKQLKASVPIKDLNRIMRDLYSSLYNKITHKKYSLTLKTQKKWQKIKR